MTKFLQEKNLKIELFNNTVQNYANNASMQINETEIKIMDYVNSTSKKIAEAEKKIVYFGKLFNDLDKNLKKYFQF